MPYRGFLFSREKKVYQPPWEYIIYGEYLARDNPKLFSPKNIDKWGRLNLPTGLIEMRHLMAGKSKPKAKSNYENTLAWANATLTDDDLVALEQWNMSDGEVLAGIMEIQTTGHSFSGKASTDGAGFTAFAIGIDPDGANAGMGLSGYGTSPTDATLALLYKHFIKCAGVWPRNEGGQKSRFR